jgi:hypothetical protein
LLGLDWLSDLNIGTTMDFFHISGNSASKKDNLKILAISLDSDIAYFLRIK